MKKIIFLCVAVAIAILTSCEEKKEYAPVVGNIYTEKIEAADGVFYRLMKLEENNYSLIFNQDLTNVKYHEHAKLVMAYINDKEFAVFNTEGDRRGSGLYNNLVYAHNDVVYLSSADSQTSLYLPDKGSVFGPYNDIYVAGDKVFAKGPKGWGLLDTNYNYLQDMVFEKLYIVNQKSAKEYDVLRCRNGKWEMVSSDESTYDEPSVKAAVKLLMSKKYKPVEPTGIIDMKF